MINAVAIASAIFGIILLILGSAFFWPEFCRQRGWGLTATLTPLLFLTWCFLVVAIYLG
jgi:hypothetical protein